MLRFIWTVVALVCLVPLQAAAAGPSPSQVVVLVASGQSSGASIPGGTYPDYLVEMIQVLPDGSLTGPCDASDRSGCYRVPEGKVLVVDSFILRGINSPDGREFGICDLDDTDCLRIPADFGPLNSGLVVQSGRKLVTFTKDGPDAPNANSDMFIGHLTEP